jgi:aconitate hydratase
MKKQELLRQITIGQKHYSYYDINVLAEKGIAVRRLPFSIRILVENLLRNLDDDVVKENDLVNIGQWQKHYQDPVEIPFHPARVLMQDFTGVPAVVDLAAMRDALKSLGGDPRKINPLIPVDLIVDHSIQVDYYGTSQSLSQNVAKEYERNTERYSFLKWAQKNFDNFHVVPPNSGICHQVNLEYLARVIITAKQDGNILYPDTLLGTDSHTTMINGVGVMGWGVGGIEAEAVMLGQPYFMPIPEVVGVRLIGELKQGVTTTDLALTITQILRRHNVVEKFVEFFGEGAKKLSVPDRATIANMSPEYGATMGFFPVDEKTIEYLDMTNREEQARITEAYTKEAGLFYTGEFTPEYTEVVELDISEVEPCLAGPSRPQDRIILSAVKKEFRTFLENKHQKDTTVKQMSQFFDESGCLTCRQGSCALSGRDTEKISINLAGRDVTIEDGSLVIAAITSCTNTSNPFVLIGAALLARNAVKKGLQVPLYVKTSFAPGSKVVVDYLNRAGLTPYLEKLGFHVVGFGCTTCIGNSGPLHPRIEKAITDNNLSVAAILSGNRNFEARIHQNIKGNFLASPMLVVAFALCGRIDVDLHTHPLGADPHGEPVYLRDLWPDNSEIQLVLENHLKPALFKTEYANIFAGDALWKGLQVSESTTFAWDPGSSYIKKPAYFSEFSSAVHKPTDITKARALLLLDDSVTTDHISPAGAIPELYPAGQYLINEDVPIEAFNSYGSRRGNHEVMIRGTFGNIRIKNKIVAPKEGSFTLKFPQNEEMYIYDAAIQYQKEQTPLVVLAGKEYGTGSSRDWAAKGTKLLGVMAVIAQSYERIHRSNLVGMGVLPLQFTAGESWQSLKLDGSEIFTILGVNEMKPQKLLQVKAVKDDGRVIDFEVISRLNTDVDVKYFEHGGILPYVLRKLSN